MNNPAKPIQSSEHVIEAAKLPGEPGSREQSSEHVIEAAKLPGTPGSPDHDYEALTAEAKRKAKRPIQGLKGSAESERMSARDPEHVTEIEPASAGGILTTGKFGPGHFRPPTESLHPEPKAPSKAAAHNPDYDGSGNDSKDSNKQ